MKSILSDVQQAIRSKTGISLIAVNLFLGIMLFPHFVNPALPRPFIGIVRGQVGLPTLTLGDFSIHPITVLVTNKGPVCLVLIAAEMDGQPFGVQDDGIFLMGDQRVYASTAVVPIGHDALFGQQKIRAFAFHPIELCQEGKVGLEDLSLLVVRPEGVGVVSFANPKLDGTGG